MLNRIKYLIWDYAESEIWFKFVSRMHIFPLNHTVVKFL